MKSRLEGMAAKMEKFHTYFGLKLTYFALRHTDMLATKLQRKDLNSAEGIFL